jgi:23S rRNA (cytosine1962-C5)-methyltransferase
MPTQYPPLRLKPREERRLRAGHLWVFSNEIDVAATPLKNFAPGDPVTIEAASGKFVGTGYVNPNTLIAARLVSRDPEHPFTPSLLVHRVKVALALRERLYPGPWYRLLFGESDGVPGLVVDRYGDVLVGQITTAGMERLKEQIETVLVKVLRPSGILWRNNSPVRALEGLPPYVSVGHGEVPERLTVREQDATFEVDARQGQKTGWFFDQQSNRASLARYVRGARVLDLFSYVGAWGVLAARAGATNVCCVDSSADAMAFTAANAEANGVAARLSCLRGDVFQVVEELRAAGESFDVVVVDPPAFIKRRKDLAVGSQGYRRLNQLAMRVLSRDGTLVSCSCSQLFSAQHLGEVLQAAARHLDRGVQIISQGQQGADHPTLPAVPETSYLKCLVARVLPA